MTSEEDVEVDSVTEERMERLRELARQLAGTGS